MSAAKGQLAILQGYMDEEGMNCIFPGTLSTKITGFH